MNSRHYRNDSLSAFTLTTLSVTTASVPGCRILLTRFFVPNKYMLDIDPVAIAERTKCQRLNKRSLTLSRSESANTTAAKNTVRPIMFNEKKTRDIRIQPFSGYASRNPDPRKEGVVMRAATTFTGKFRQSVEYATTNPTAL